MSDVVVEPVAVEPTNVTEPTQAEPASEPSDKVEAAPKPKRKIKSNGREVEVDEAEVDRILSKELSADEKFREAAKLRKEVDKFTKDWEENPTQALKALKTKNPKIREAVEEFLLEEIKREEEEASLSPEAKELKKYKEKEKADAEEKAKQEEQAKLKEQSAADAKYIAEFDRDLTAALTQHNIPKSPQFIKRVASYMADALDNDMELTPAEAVEHVKQDYMRDLQHFIASIDDILPWVGEEVASKIRKSDLARVKSGKPASTKHAETTKDAEPRKFRTSKEMAEETLRILEGMG